MGNFSAGSVKVADEAMFGRCIYFQISCLDQTVFLTGVNSSLVNTMEATFDWSDRITLEKRKMVGTCKWIGDKPFGGRLGYFPKEQ